ncbi:hypothetical protein BROC_02011 [Candidatus Brocadiaceae bacterium]|nr:hypothetical protein BROC_02011 [Candidatus Brocadiaceae bacterium]
MEITITPEPLIAEDLKLLAQTLDEYLKKKTKVTFILAGKLSSIGKEVFVFLGIRYLLFSTK